jgi:hypothetical protein
MATALPTAPGVGVSDIKGSYPGRSFEPSGHVPALRPVAAHDHIRQAFPAARHDENRDVRWAARYGLGLGAAPAVDAS